MSSRFIIRALAVVASCLLVLAACGSDEPSADPGDTAVEVDRPLILVTTTVLGDVVSTLVADDAEVEVVMPVGVDPHDFEPSARQATRLREADVVVANGLELEVGLLGALDSAVADGATVIEVGELVDTLPFGVLGHEHDDDEVGHDDDVDDHGHDDDEVVHDDEVGHDEDDGHGHGDEDPHFWHDPTRMAAAIPGLVDELVAAVPALDTSEVRDRADALVEELTALDQEIDEILSVVPAERRYLITNHDTFGYFADRYDFEIIGAVIPGGDTLAAPSAGAMARLVEEIEEHDLPAIFAETVVASRLVDSLAAEADLDVEVVTLYTDSLGEPGSGADTYIGMLLTNARLVAEALR